MGADGAAGWRGLCGTSRSVRADCLAGTTALTFPAMLPTPSRMSTVATGFQLRARFPSYRGGSGALGEPRSIQTADLVPAAVAIVRCITGQLRSVASTGLPLRSLTVESFLDRDDGGPRALDWIVYRLAAPALGRLSVTKLALGGTVIGAFGGGGGTRRGVLSRSHLAVLHTRPVLVDDDASAEALPRLLVAHADTLRVWSVGFRFRDGDEGPAGMLAAQLARASAVAAAWTAVEAVASSEAPVTESTVASTSGPLAGWGAGKGAAAAVEAFLSGADPGPLVAGDGVAPPPADAEALSPRSLAPPLVFPALRSFRLYGTLSEADAVALATAAPGLTHLTLHDGLSPLAAAALRAPRAFPALADLRCLGKQTARDLADGGSLAALLAGRALDRLAVVGMEPWTTAPGGWMVDALRGGAALPRQLALATAGGSDDWVFGDVDVARLAAPAAVDAGAPLPDGPPACMTGRLTDLTIHLDAAATWAAVPSLARLPALTKLTLNLGGAAALSTVGGMWPPFPALTDLALSWGNLGRTAVRDWFRGLGPPPRFTVAAGASGGHIPREAAGAAAAAPSALRRLTLRDGYAVNAGNRGLGGAFGVLARGDLAALGWWPGLEHLTLVTRDVQWVAASAVPPAVVAAAVAREDPQRFPDSSWVGKAAKGVATAAAAAAAAAAEDGPKGGGGGGGGDGGDGGVDGTPPVSLTTLRSWLTADWPSVRVEPHVMDGRVMDPVKEEAPEEG